MHQILYEGCTTMSNPATTNLVLPAIGVSLQIRRAMAGEIPGLRRTCGTDYTTNRGHCQCASFISLYPFPAASAEAGSLPQPGAAVRAGARFDARCDGTTAAPHDGQRGG